MTDRRGSRFAFEVLFLVALAVALTFAKLDALEIAGVMLLGWIIVAALEWAAWRGQPHFGSGLPPRYYVPSVSLPPAQPLEQVAVDGYPDASRDEAPTWIAPAALRAEVLGEWPSAVRLEEPEPEPELESEPAPAVALPPVLAEEPDEPEPTPEPEPESEPQSEPEVEPEPEPTPEMEPPLDLVLQRSAQGVARYSLDPLAEPVPKRRFARGPDRESVPSVEVPARPAGVRALPGRSGQD